MRLLRAALLLAAALAAASAAPAQEPRGESGAFDYWLLSLSWSPAFCAGEGGRSSPEQCGPGRRYGFVVHGLWPQWQAGGWPQFCAPVRDVPDPLERAMLPIMPSRRLIEHQWRKHGSCSGLDVAGYFAATRRAFEGIRIPEPLRAPARPLELPAEDVERLFAEANPGLSPEGVAVTCRGRDLAELRICLDADLRPRPCGRGVADRCPKGAVRLRPVR